MERKYFVLVTATRNTEFSDLSFQSAASKSLRSEGTTKNERILIMQPADSQPH